MSGLANTVSGHTATLGELRTTATQTASDISDIKTLVLNMARNPTTTPPPTGGDSGGAAPPPGSAPSARGASGSSNPFGSLGAATLGLDALPLLTHVVDEDQILKLLTVLGISQSRTEVVAALGDLPCLYTDTWSKIGRLKSISQWKTKMITLGKPLSETTNITAVGDILYRFLDTNSVLSSVPLQGLPQVD